MKITVLTIPYRLATVLDNQTWPERCQLYSYLYNHAHFIYLTASIIRDLFCCSRIRVIQCYGIIDNVPVTHSDNNHKQRSNIVELPIFFAKTLLSSNRILLYAPALRDVLLADTSLFSNLHFYLIAYILRLYVIIFIVYVCVWYT